MTGDSFWTPALIGELCRLWAEGIATAEIGRRLGCSKNAVIGKARRLDLSARAARKTVAPQRTWDFPPQRGCRWPQGHPKETAFHFCGAPVAGHRPYCAEHSARAYTEDSKP